MTSLIVGDKKTVASINAPFLNNSDQSALNKFLTQAVWDEYELNRRRVELKVARLHRRPVSSRAGRLIIDDTLAHHTQCRIEELAYLKDHTLKRYVWAHNVVTSYYLNQADQFPVDFWPYLQFRKKKWLANLAEMAAQLQTEPTLKGHHHYLVSLLALHRKTQVKNDSNCHFDVTVVSCPYVSPTHKWAACWMESLALFMVYWG